MEHNRWKIKELLERKIGGKKDWSLNRTAIKAYTENTSANLHSLWQWIINFPHNQFSRYLKKDTDLQWNNFLSYNKHANTHLVVHHAYFLHSLITKPYNAGHCKVLIIIISLIIIMWICKAVAWKILHSLQHLQGRKYSRTSITKQYKWLLC